MTPLTDTAAFCLRMRAALRLSAQLHHALPLLTREPGPFRCAHPGCPATALELVGRRLWCAEHLAEQVAEALIAETMGEDHDA